jgi:hypothetical protein
VLDAKHVIVEIGDPLPTRCGDVQIGDCLADVRGDTAPVEFRIAVDEIGGAILS